MATFAFVITLSFIGFGNTFYILALNGITYRNCTIDKFIGISDEEFVAREDSCTPFTGDNFLMAIIYAFKTGLGDFDTEEYDNVDASPLIWIVFLLCAILI